MGICEETVKLRFSSTQSEVSGETDGSPSRSALLEPSTCVRLPGGYVGHGLLTEASSNPPYVSGCRQSSGQHGERKPGVTRVTEPGLANRVSLAHIRKVKSSVLQIHTIHKNIPSAAPGTYNVRTASTGMVFTILKVQSAGQSVKTGRMYVRARRWKGSPYWPFCLITSSMMLYATTVCGGISKETLLSFSLFPFSVTETCQAATPKAFL